MRAALYKFLVSFGLLIVVGITVASDILPPQRTGNFYVSNFSRNNVVVYDSLGNYLRNFTTAGRWRSGLVLCIFQSLFY